MTSSCYENPNPACSCEDGFVRNRDGVCRDLDECSDEGVGNDCVDNATCNNISGNFTCICPEGFEGDGRLSGTGCTET